MLLETIQEVTTRTHQYHEVAGFLFLPDMQGLAIFCTPPQGCIQRAVLGLSPSGIPLRLLPVPAPRCRCSYQSSRGLITFLYCTQA